MQKIFASGLLLLQSLQAVRAACECGYREPGSGNLFTHRIYDDFSEMADTRTPRLESWDVQTWNATLKDMWAEKNIVTRNVDESNVWIEDGKLVLRQRAWSGRGPVSAAEIHSKADDIYHGSFAAKFRIREDPDAEGGATAGFFFYHSDKAESDIEILTNDKDRRSVHYTNHPSYNAEEDETIPGTSYKDRLPKPWSEFQEHRFEWTEDEVSFYQDGKDEPARVITKSVPDEPGKIMINLWANNGSWSGRPSSEDVFMEIEFVSLLFNTSDSDAGNDDAYNQACADADENSSICDPCGEPIPLEGGEDAGDDEEDAAVTLVAGYRAAVAVFLVLGTVILF